MFLSLFSSSLKLRFALWAVEQAMPSQTELKIRLRSALLAMGTAVAGGVLCALAIGALLTVGFFLLKEQGVPPYIAALSMVMVMLLIATAFAIRSKHLLAEATESLKRQRRYLPRGSHGIIYNAVDGFLAGLAKRKDYYTRNA
jgi:hypothetical protein